MKLPTILLLSCYLLCSLAHANTSGVRLTLVKTADAPVREAMLVAGGDWSKILTLNHVAVLVDHPQHPHKRLMFDAGLSAGVETERHANINWLLRQWPLLSYHNLRPARQQLPAALRPQIIALSHIHWDHASGVNDFPEAEVWVDRCSLARRTTLPPRSGARSKSWLPVFDLTRP